MKRVYGLVVGGCGTRRSLGAMSVRRGIRALSVGGASLLMLAAFGTIGGGADAAGPKAFAARALSLNEVGHLRLTSHHGFRLNEKGSASGVIRGTIYIHLDVVSTNRVTAEVNIYPSGGSLTGNAMASYHVAGATAHFSGTMSIARGTGSFSRAHGSGLGFSGTIRRTDDAVTVYLSGRMSV